MRSYRRRLGQCTMRHDTHMAHVLFARNRCQYAVPCVHGQKIPIVTAAAQYTVSVTSSHDRIVPTAWRSAVTPAV